MAGKCPQCGKPADWMFTVRRDGQSVSLPQGGEIHFSQEFAGEGEDKYRVYIGVLHYDD